MPPIFHCMGADRPPSLQSRFCRPEKLPESGSSSLAAGKCLPDHQLPGSRLREKAGLGEGWGVGGLKVRIWGV